MEKAASQTVSQAVDQAVKQDVWPILLFGVHLGHAILFASLYPYHVYDTDLLAYFIYFDNWHTLWTSSGVDVQSLPISQFFVPKPLLCFTLGTLGSAQAAFYCTAFASATLGSLVYLVGRRFFSWSLGLLLSVLLLLDPFKGILTLESSADLYVAVFLFAAIYSFAMQRPAISALCLLISALAKPVTLPCIAIFILYTNKKQPTLWRWALLPCLAIPLIFLSNWLLLGNIGGSTEHFATFNDLRQITPLAPHYLLHFVVWEYFIQYRFVFSWLFGFVGILLWLTQEKRNLTSPFFLLPLLFLGGYLLVSIFIPHAPFLRFYWPLEIWFVAFIIYGIQESARRIFRSHQCFPTIMASLLICLPVYDTFQYHDTYRKKFVVPFETEMAFVSSAVQVLQHEKQPNETILSPLAFMPYVMWKLEIPEWVGPVIPAEDVGTQPLAKQPDWIVYVPKISANPQSIRHIKDLINQGAYKLRLRSQTAALLHRTSQANGEENKIASRSTQ